MAADDDRRFFQHDARALLAALAALEQASDNETMGALAAQYGRRTVSDLLDEEVVALRVEWLLMDVHLYGR